ncbi:MAG: lipid-A-disaccharide synthase [bacterium]
MRVIFAAGERSGFVLAELLRKQLYAIEPGGELFNINVGDETGEIIGFSEPLANLVNGISTFKKAIETIRQIKPEVAVLISFPGINLPLGQKLRSFGIPVIYISPPQFWAWGKFRVACLRRAADLVVCLFDFEQAILRRAGINAVYYGYPFFDGIKRHLLGHQVNDLLRLPDGTDYVVFLPGSRKPEIEFHQPLFVRVFGLLREKYPSLRAVLIGGRDGDLPAGMLRLEPDYRFDVIAYARAVLAVSGTVTAEVAILGVPMVVSYHLNPVSRFLARLFVKLPYFSLPNIIAGERLVPEYLEPEPRQLSAALKRVLADGDYRRRLIVGLQQVRKRLGPPGAIEKIARQILMFNGNRRY